ncbi:MAG TPA: SDR family oxidoreductase [Gammaproteobacteria bacterium]|nr:SDR family oxidoreductase [Gammaproteobacteria bacterium]
MAQPHSAEGPGVALVTGGSRGIGFATAEALLRAGARVALCARDRRRLTAAEHALRSLGPVLPVAADLRDPAAARAVVERVHGHWGGPDILVNNAGLAWAGPLVDHPPQSIDAMIDVNVRAPIHLCRAVLPGMIARGQGVIINVASGAGRHGIGELAVYSATKFALVGLTEALADEVGGTGVRVYGICPGRVATDMQEQVSGRRIGLAPERVGALINDLAGPQPRARPGQCITLR